MGAWRASGRAPTCTWSAREIPLYDGQDLRLDGERFLTAEGFALRERRNEHMAGEQLVPADYLFERVRSV